MLIAAQLLNGLRQAIPIEIEMPSHAAPKLPSSPHSQFLLLTRLVWPDANFLAFFLPANARRASSA